VINDNVKNLELPLSEIYERTLIRLPLYFELSLQEADYIIEMITEFFKQGKTF